MFLKELNQTEAEWGRRWRNTYTECLRTPYLLTREMQEDFYKNEICNRNSPHRFWGIWENKETCIGIGGITYIQWENGIGEITVNLDPAKRGEGLGRQAAELLLKEGFEHLRLQTIFGECYLTNPMGCAMWAKITDKYKGYKTELPRRKFWDGRLWNALYFSITEEDYFKNKK